MLKTFNRLSTAVYVKALILGTHLKEDLRSLREDERGLSGIVVAVMLIVVAVLAAILLWDKLSEWIDHMWQTITSKGDSLGGE